MKRPRRGPHSQRDEPIGAFVFALYGLLFLMVMALVLVWLTGSAT